MLVSLLPCSKLHSSEEIGTFFRGSSSSSSATVTFPMKLNQRIKKEFVFPAAYFESRTLFPGF